ncbi:MAG: hypothetical protein LBD67_10710 [Candidatus Accumulibacter sp.]|jgi:hypothetical protein|nr:hypothetical protein [Accumulibacter sp.]
MNKAGIFVHGIRMEGSRYGGCWLPEPYTRTTALACEKMLSEARRNRTIFGKFDGLSIELVPWRRYTRISLRYFTVIFKRIVHIPKILRIENGHL